MSKSTMTSRVENERILILERTFKAPRDLVWKMFQDADHLKRWWGPRGWELSYCKVDFRPGGVWHYCMKCMDKNQGDFYGFEAWGKAVYGSISEPKSIAYTDYFSDAEGNNNESMPSTKITMEFVEVDGQTKLISRGEYVSPEALQQVMNMGMMEGITQTWDRLEEALQKAQ